MNCDNPKVGMAGESLVVSHLLSLGLEVAPILGRDADVIVKLHNRWIEIQVKTSIDGNFVSGTAWHAGTDKARRKFFTEYDVDGFAFCRLSSPYPYYIHADAIRNKIKFPEYAFSRAERDRSWDEFSRRSEMTPGEVTEREVQSYNEGQLEFLPTEQAGHTDYRPLQVPHGDLQETNPSKAM